MSTCSTPPALVHITPVIFEVRGQRVIIDADLAALYGVSTKRLNEQVKRNSARFPEDFVFLLSAAEVEELNRSQIATGSQKHRDPRFPPRAFTEHGAIQAANVLNSDRAVEMGVHVVRAFVRLRQALFSHKELSHQVERLEKKYERHDKELAKVLMAIRELMNVAPKKRRGIGFTAKIE
ncbi:MAG: ORF6N domain-containing protein [Steroidobacteraceae bacterium]|nr:ORF6N domain-containing protein [Steroidobacteraceae bacterium]